MDRLTNRYDDGEAFCDKFSVVDDVGVDETILKGELIDKLADYEDAEEQGLLLRLPCKVGDTVWVDSRTVQKSIECYGNKKWLDYDELPLYFKARVVSVKIGRGKSIKLAIKAKYFYQGLWSDVEYNTEDVYVLKSYVFSSIGKTVFLTKEEAEQALKDMKGDSNEQTANVWHLEQS